MDDPGMWITGVGKWILSWKGVILVVSREELFKIKEGCDSGLGVGPVILAAQPTNSSEKYLIYDRSGEVPLLLDFDTSTEAGHYLFPSK